MKPVVMLKVFLMAVVMMLFLSGFALAEETECTMNPKSLSMNYNGIVKKGDTINFTVDVASECEGKTPNYCFTYSPDYGKTWVNMPDKTEYNPESVKTSTVNTCPFIFSEAGRYIVVAHVSPEADSLADPSNSIGTTVEVLSTESAGTECIMNPKSLSMNYNGIVKKGDTINFTVEVESECADKTPNYCFTYSPDYGKTWVNMPDKTAYNPESVKTSTVNTCPFIFNEAGHYIVVAHVSPEANSLADPSNSIGTTVEVLEPPPCAFESTELNVSVIDAITGKPVSNAEVTLPDLKPGKVFTNDVGGAKFTDLPVNKDAKLNVTKFGYSQQNMDIQLACAQTQSQKIALFPSNVDGDIRVLLSWNGENEDLDAHMTGPKTSGASDRFHVYYWDDNNCGNSKTPCPCDPKIPAWIDTFDQAGVEHETITIHKTDNPLTPEKDGSFTPGTYRYYVHHYKGSSSIPATGASVQIYKGNQLINGGSFNAPTPAANAAIEQGYVWSVFEMNLAADGTYSINPVNTYSSTDSDDDTTIFRKGIKLPSFIPEVYHLFMSLPSK